MRRRGGSEQTGRRVLSGYTPGPGLPCTSAAEGCSGGAPDPRMQQGQAEAEARQAHLAGGAQRQPAAVRVAVHAGLAQQRLVPLRLVSRQLVPQRWVMLLSRRRGGGGRAGVSVRRHEHARLAPAGGIRGRYARSLVPHALSAHGPCTPACSVTRPRPPTHPPTHHDVAHAQVGMNKPQPALGAVQGGEHLEQHLPHCRRGGGRGSGWVCALGWVEGGTPMEGGRDNA